jgi:formate hydrogenlyase transcriptional activator
MKASASLQHKDHIPVKAKAELPSPDGQVVPGASLFTPEIREVAAELFTRFVKISSTQIDAEIVVSIRKIVECLGVDRGFLSQCSSDGTRMVCTHCWSARGDNTTTMPLGLSPVPWVHHQVLQGRYVNLTCLEDLPEEAAQDLEYFSSVGTNSLLLLPLEIDGKVIGSFALENIYMSGNFKWDVLPALELVADVFAGVVERKRRKLEVIERLRFESLLNDISARFVLMDLGDIDLEIVSSLQLIAEFFHGDRCGILEVDSENINVRISYAWYAEGIDQVSKDFNLAPLFPWAYEKLVVQGESVYFSTLQELPSAAKQDCQSWMAMGVRSALAIPLYMGKRVRYLITFQNTSRERNIVMNHIDRLRLLGEIFVHALMRKDTEEKLRVSYREIQELKDKLQVEAEYLRTEIKLSKPHEEMIGQSKELSKVLTLVEQVARTDSTVLICGETGTGKELVARAIHNNSQYRDKLMVKVNCASLPASLVESELFGREKGAYTGALSRQIGRFELADGSTIFLDEIAELPLELQSKLLRVLQENEFERLGSPKTIHVKVRVIAATNRNILDEVKKGNFREDLYYRLNVFPICVPPLREREEDIPLLVWSFVNEFCEKMGKQVHKIAKREMEALQRYSWPGNIRELRNVIEHAVIVSTGGILQVQLPQDARSEIFQSMTLEELETQHIMDVLRRTNGHIKGEGGAAQILGLIPSTLYSRMKKLGIKIYNDKDEISS